MDDEAIGIILVLLCITVGVLIGIYINMLFDVDWISSLQIMFISIAVVAFFASCIAEASM